MRAENRFLIDTDANRYLEYSTPRHNLDREAVAQRSVDFLARFAEFPAHLVAGSWPEWFRDSAEKLSPSLSRETLALSKVRP